MASQVEITIVDVLEYQWISKRMLHF